MCWVRDDLINEFNQSTNLESPKLINGARLKHAKLHNVSAIREYCKQQQRQQGIPVIPERNQRQNIQEDEMVNPDPEDNNTQMPPVEKVIDLSRNNKGKWYRVKFQGRKGINGFKMVFSMFLRT